MISISDERFKRYEIGHDYMLPRNVEVAKQENSDTKTLIVRRKKCAVIEEGFVTLG